MSIPLRALGALAASTVMLTACGQSADPGGESQDTAESNSLVITYDGGLLVLDHETLEVIEDISLDGFNRVSPAGDGQHVMVATSSGFRPLDTAKPELSDEEFPAEEAGHVVHHADTTALFADGTGEVTMFDPRELSDGLPETEQHASEHPHHGVAVRLSNGELVTTVGDEEEVSGIEVLDEHGHQIASEECTGIHGEATAADETVVVGCEQGVLTYQGGEIAKVDSPDDYGRIGNQAGHEDSPFVLGDYKTDPEAELERPQRVAIVDSEAKELELLELETSYSFRSLGRGGDGEGLVLGTDGAIHVIDMENAEVTDSIAVIEEWEEPLDWQQPSPSLHVDGDRAFVTDPQSERIHAVDLAGGEVETDAALPHTPNELTGT